MGFYKVVPSVSVHSDADFFMFFLVEIQYIKNCGVNFIQSDTRENHRTPKQNRCNGGTIWFDLNIGNNIWQPMG